MGEPADGQNGASRRRSPLIIATEGLGGLWKWILDRIGDFQEMVMGEIREFISEKVIKAGIEWLIQILNPAAKSVHQGV